MSAKHSTGGTIQAMQAYERELVGQLHRAIDNADIEAVQEVLNRPDLDINNANDSEQCPPLHHAVRNLEEARWRWAHDLEGMMRERQAQKSIVTLLLKHGAAPETTATVLWGKKHWGAPSGVDSLQWSARVRSQGVTAWELGLEMRARGPPVSWTGFGSGSTAFAKIRRPLMGYGVLERLEQRARRRKKAHATAPKPASGPLSRNVPPPFASPPLSKREMLLSPLPTRSSLSPSPMYHPVVVEATPPPNNLRSPQFPGPHQWTVDPVLLGSVHEPQRDSEPHAPAPPSPADLSFHQPRLPSDLMLRADPLEVLLKKLHQAKEGTAQTPAATATSPTSNKTHQLTHQLLVDSSGRHPSPRGASTPVTPRMRVHSSRFSTPPPTPRVSFPT